MKLKNSKIGKLNWIDLLKGLGIAIATAFVAGLGQSLTTGKFPSNINDLQPIALAAGSAGIAYIVKNLSENSEGKPFVKEPEVTE